MTEEQLDLAKVEPLLSPPTRGLMTQIVPVEIEASEHCLVGARPLRPRRRLLYRRWRVELLAIRARALPAVPEELQGIEPAEKDWRDVFGTEVGDVIAEAYTLDRLCPPGVQGAIEASWQQSQVAAEREAIERDLPVRRPRR